MDGPWFQNTGRMEPTIFIDWWGSFLVKRLVLYPAVTCIVGWSRWIPPLATPSLHYVDALYRYVDSASTGEAT